MFQSLLLKSFRNFEEVSLSFSPRVNVFIGENGQGKTNLLEALYISSTGNTFRYAENINLIKKEKSEANIKAKILLGDFDYELKIQILKSKKNYFLQNKKIPASVLLQKFPVVIFSPESLAAIKEGSDQRRQLVDDYLVSFNNKNAELILEFKKCLKTRNKILKQLQENQDEYSQKVLESINPIFIKLSIELTQQRILAINTLLPKMNEVIKSIFKKNVDIMVEYVISGENFAQKNRSDIENALHKRMVELSAAEKASGVSLVGPQKHDIKFLYCGNDSRFYCSQGQQRALILSFKMAQIVYHKRAYGTYPVLMLDDVLSELDSYRRESLISFLTEINSQIFITTTDIELPKEIKFGATQENCSVVNIQDGEVI